MNNKKPFNLFFLKIYNKDKIMSNIIANLALKEKLAMKLKNVIKTTFRLWKGSSITFFYIKIFEYIGYWCFSNTCGGSSA